MKGFHVLWVDDEIDYLKPHILFLEQRGYTVHSCNSGAEALSLVSQKHFDIVLLDENMPGISGLETLSQIKIKQPTLPIVMITKSEEENIMEEAIGGKISDYLIKPVNPNQILLSLKKNLDHSRLVSEKATLGYQQEFRTIAMDMSSINSYEGWMELYEKLLYWELELENVEDSQMLEILSSQKAEANIQFGKFIEKNYADLIEDSNGIEFSHTLFKNEVFPKIGKETPTLLLVIDNLRYDQWKVIEPVIEQHYTKQKEMAYSSILPTATQYARNSMFSGLMPSEMEKQHPDWWKNDTDEGGKNLHEASFLEAQLSRLNKDISFQYHKITQLKNGKKLAETLETQKTNDLTVIVYNFVDMVSHAKTEMEVIKELASTDKAYRSLTLSWFNNSPLYEIIQHAQNLGFQLMITTDHGTINVKNPSKIIGDRESSQNLRYKTGKRLNYEARDVLAVTNPSDFYLPTINMTSSFVFAKESYYLTYPNNYNKFVNYFKNTYQHGGISIEEMIIPFVVLSPK